MRDISFLKSCQGRKWFTAKQGVIRKFRFFLLLLGARDRDCDQCGLTLNPKPQTLGNPNTKVHGTRVLLHTHQEEEEEEDEDEEGAKTCTLGVRPSHTKIQRHICVYSWPVDGADIGFKHSVIGLG